MTQTLLNGYAWTGLIAGMYPYAAAHMDTAKTPAGVNLGMLDGHVEMASFYFGVDSAAGGRFDCSGLLLLGTDSEDSP